MIAAILVSTALAAEPALPEKDLAEFVAEHLDVTTIRSSIGPRREKTKHFFKDYGFSIAKSSNDEATLENKSPGDEWRFEISVIDHSKETVTICLRDKALNGGSYSTQSAYQLKLVDGFFKPISKAAVKNEKCPELSK